MSQSQRFDAQYEEPCPYPSAAVPAVAHGQPHGQSPPAPAAVLDYGLWGRDERSALRWLARSVAASCQVIYLPVDRDVMLARIAHRQAATPHQTFPMSEADVDQWEEQFQVPDAAELDGRDIPSPPPGWPGWPEWAVDHWPSLTCS